MSNYFIFGLMYDKFGGQVVEDHLQLYKGGYLNSVCNAAVQWYRSQCYGAGPSYLNAAFECLKTFNFGLNYGEFGGLLLPVEDLHQRVLCFAAANFHVNSISIMQYIEQW